MSVLGIIRVHLYALRDMVFTLTHTGHTKLVAVDVSTGATALHASNTCSVSGCM